MQTTLIYKLVGLCHWPPREQPILSWHSAPVVGVCLSPHAAAAHFRIQSVPFPDSPFESIVAIVLPLQHFHDQEAVVSDQQAFP